MLKSVEQLQTGLISPRSFQAATTMNRVFDMQLSKFCKVERFHNSGINSLDIDRIEERYLLSGGKNGAICIHDLQNSTGKLCNTSKAVCKVKSGSQHAHRFSVITVQWYPFDTGIFITSGMDNKLKLWDTNSMRPADTIPLEYKASCHNMSTISTQHSLIAVALGYPHVVLLDPKTGSRCHELRGHHSAVSYVRWSPTSEYLLASGGIDNRILLWDIRSAKGYLRSLDQHNGEAIGNRKDLKTAHDGSVVCMRFTDDGLYLVSYGSDCNIRVWDVALCKNTLVNFGTLYDNTVIYTRSMDLCCDSSPPTLFIPCNNFLYAYDLFNGCRIKNFVGHFSSVNSCVFRSSSHHLYSAGNDMNILIWTPDVEREEEEHLSRKESKKDGQNIDSDAWSSDEES